MWADLGVYMFAASMTFGGLLTLTGDEIQG
jgi:hypothetical protein